MNKTLREWEKERSFIIKHASEKELDNQISEDEIQNEMNNFLVANRKVGVIHDDRIDFLINNGYEVNRENMVDLTLSAKPKD